MRHYVVCNPRLIHGRQPGTSPDVSDCLITFDYDIEMVRYIARVGDDRWVDEGHTLHITLEEALQDLCNRCVSFALQIAGLREKVVAQIKRVESED